MRRFKFGNTTIGKLIDLKATALEDEDINTVRVDKFESGLMTDASPFDIPDDAFSLFSGFFINNGKIRPYEGSIESFSPEPNTLRVIGLDSVLRYDKSVVVIRATPTTIHKWDGSAWTTIAGPALIGGAYDRFSIFAVQDRIFFNNHGANVLMEVNTTANTYAAVGATAKKYKYYVVANRRIIGAYSMDGLTNPQEVGSSGNLNFGVWDPSVDVSAFINVLIDPEGNDSDEITGMVALKDNVLIFKRRSIWIGVPQEIASSPFKWVKIFSSIGCTCEYSIKKCGDDTVIWYDIYTNNFYRFKLGEESVEPIGNNIRLNLKDLIVDADKTHSNWDPQLNIYELYIEDAQEEVLAQRWCYNLNNKNWNCDLRVGNISVANSIILPSGSGTWDSLIGSWDGLLGSWDGLSALPNKPKRVTATSNPLIAGKLYLDSGHTLVVGHRAFPTFITSKVFSYKDSKISFLSLSVDVEAINFVADAPGFLLSVVTDKIPINKTPTTVEELGDYKFFSSPSVTVIEGSPKKFTFKFTKHINCNNFYFVIIPTALFHCNILGYRLRVTRGGTE